MGATAQPRERCCKNAMVHTLNGSSMLITGGTGSFGKAFTRWALDHADPAPTRHLLPRRAQAVRDAPATRRRPAHALVHRRRPRPRPPEPCARRGRVRRACRGAQAGRHRRVQPVRVHRRPTSSGRERDQRVDRCRGPKVSRCRPTRRRARSTCTARPSCVPTSCSSPATTTPATAPPGSRWSATAT
jgi:hypothetical protein